MDVSDISYLPNIIHWQGDAAIASYVKLHFIVARLDGELLHIKIKN